MYWYITVIGLCLLLLVFLLWKEILRLNKERLAVRIIASALCVISLACISLPLTFEQTQIISGDKEAIFLTQGFNEDSVHAILSENRNAEVYTTDSKLKAFKAKYIADISLLSTPSQHIHAIHVIGYGLDENDVKLLHGIPVIFHPSAVVNRIISICWTQQLKLGEPLLVQGKYNNTTSSRAKIVLTAFNANLDSIEVGEKQISSFQLSTVPKHLDKALYSITVLSGKDTIEHEPIPIEVKTTAPFSILLLSASPDFENKFLFNWLSKNEYKLAARTTISKDKFNKAFINLPSVSLDHITPSQLEKFDVVIADASALSQLPASEFTSIKNSVKSNGLGLIVKADSAMNASSFYAKLFPMTEVKDSIQHAIKLNVIDTGNTTSPLKINQPIYIRSLAATQSLVKDQQMHTMVSSKLFGSGKIVLTTIGNTFSWQLSGKNNDYTNYWSGLLQKAAKQKPLHEVWNISPTFPQKNEEVHLLLQTNEAGIPHAQLGEDMAYMQQSCYLPYRWNATYWPAKTGWQPIISEDGKSDWWYVYDSKDWSAIKAMEKLKATKKYERHHPYTSKSFTISTETTAEFPKIYFFVLFVICAGFLWFENKFNNR